MSITIRRNVETLITRMTLKCLKDVGMTFAEADERESRTDCIDTMLALCMNLDMPLVVVYKDGKRFGWVQFVYGNDGWDCLADHTINLESVLKKAILLSTILSD